MFQIKLVKRTHKKVNFGGVPLEQHVSEEGREGDQKRSCFNNLEAETAQPCSCIEYNYIQVHFAYYTFCLICPHCNKRGTCRATVAAEKVLNVTNARVVISGKLIFLGERRRRNQNV